MRENPLNLNVFKCHVLSYSILLTEVILLQISAIIIPVSLCMTLLLTECIDRGELINNLKTIDE